MNIEKVKSARREIKTYVELMRGAESMLDKAESGMEGGFYCLMSSLTLSAFSFEAFLNHLGIKYLSLWDKETRIPLKEKYSRLAATLKLDEPDFSRGYDMKLSRLILHRNNMAHGVPHDEKMRKETVVPENDCSFLLNAQWEDFITLKNAKDSIECVSEIINKLNSAAGLGDWAFTSGTEVAEVESVALNKSLR